MKFKGQGKINICGFEYKNKIADSRRGGFRAPKKNPVSAPETVYRASVYTMNRQAIGGVISIPKVGTAPPPTSVPFINIETPMMNLY